MTFVRMADGSIQDSACPLWLFKLLARAPLSTRAKLGPEDRVGIAFADACRAHAMNGRLRGTFTHIPHEVGGGGGRASQVRYAVANALGLVAGSGDYVFVRPGQGLWLEAKRPKLTKAEHGRSDSGGVLNEDQKRFRDWCEREAVPYHIFTSADEGEDYLRRYGFLEGV